MKSKPFEGTVANANQNASQNNPTEDCDLLFTPCSHLIRSIGDFAFAPLYKIPVTGFYSSMTESPLLALGVYGVLVRGVADRLAHTVTAAAEMTMASDLVTDLVTGI